MKLQIDLHDAHWKLLEQMAADNYRDPRQQAAWLVSCAVAGWAVHEADSSEETATSPESQQHYAHTDADGTTVLCGNKAIADAQRTEDERRGGFAAIACGREMNQS